MVNNNEQAIGKLQEEIRKFKIKCNFFKESNKRLAGAIERLSIYDGESFKRSTSFVDLCDELKRYEVWCEIERNKIKVIEERKEQLQTIFQDMLFDKQKLMEGYQLAYNDETLKKQQYIDDLRKDNSQLMDDLKSANDKIAFLLQDLRLYKDVSEALAGRNELDKPPVSDLQENTIESCDKKTLAEYEEELMKWSTESVILKKAYEDKKKIFNKILKDAETSFSTSSLSYEMKNDLEKYKEDYEGMECKKHTLENEINEIQKSMEQVYFDNQELSEKHQISYLIGMTRAPQCIDQLEKENLHLSDCLKKVKSIIINLEKEINEYDQIKKLMQLR